VGIEHSTILPKPHKQRRCSRSYSDNHYKYYKKQSPSGRPDIFTCRRTEVAEFDCAGTDLGVRTCLGRRRPPVQIRAPRPKHLAHFLELIKSPLHPKLHCGILPDRRSRFAGRLIPKTSLHAEDAKTRVGRSAIQKLLNGGKLRARHLASMGKIMGTLCISHIIDLRKPKPGAA
jgi:hypothetical protein